MNVLRRFVVPAVLASSLALLLASCMSLRGELTFDRQARASGQLTVALSKQVASQAGITSADAFAAQLSGGNPLGSVRVLENDQAYVATAKVSDRVFTDPDGLSAAVADGKAVDFQLKLNLGDAQATSGDHLGLGGVQQLGTIELTVRFPGAVSSFSGPGADQLDRRTVRIKTPLTPSTNGPWTVRSGIDPPASPATTLLPVPLGAAGIGAVGFLVVRQRRRQPAASPAPAPQEVIGS
jgi:hypothetical protein